MRADHGGRAQRERLRQLLKQAVGTEQRRPDDRQLRAERVERAHDRVVLKAADDHAAAGLYQRFDRQIQAMRRVHGEHHLLWRGVEQLRRQRAAGKDRLRRPLGCRMAAPPDAGVGADGAADGLGNGRRLLQRGGGAVKVDHGCTSRHCPFSLR